MLRCRYRDPGYVRVTATGKIVRGGSVSTADVTDCVACGQRRKVSQKGVQILGRFGTGTGVRMPNSQVDVVPPKRAEHGICAIIQVSHRLRAGRSVYSL